MSAFRLPIVRQLETLADGALFAAIPFVALFMAVAMIKLG